MTNGKKRGRPRKNPEPAQASTPSQEATKQIIAGLDRLAIARDFALTAAAGDEDPKDFEDLAAEVRRAISEAGEKLEQGLCGLGLLPAGKSGWFVADLRRGT